MKRAEREAMAQRLNQYKVYKRYYKATEKRYGDTLYFYKGYNTKDEALKVVQSNPQQYFM